jgi:type IV fimbrial biogenesis protein FimT
MAGFTVLELMFVCAIAALLAGVAAPGFREYSLNARRTGQVNELVHALHASRSAAIRGGLPVVLCKSSDGSQCTPAAAGWDEGWIAFVNRDSDSPAAVDADEPILLRQPRVEGISIRANRDALTYWPFSRAGTTATFIFCDQRGVESARAVIVSQTGRPRTSRAESCGQP